MPGMAPWSAWAPAQKALRRGLRTMVHRGRLGPGGGGDEGRSEDAGEQASGGAILPCHRLPTTTALEHARFHVVQQMAVVGPAAQRIRADA